MSGLVAVEISLRRVLANLAPRFKFDFDIVEERLEIVKEQKDWRNIDVIAVFMAIS
eukprot:CAMPEP_0182515604 /NCGR_PEP_ID=MMETSP1321-20130603/38489_1 /TAXON_ID=91990 /ORGANISM="Bolidomonas sp., Strain RCC1657" /LENGTH=55 /DNA_ID=CAMNT_0024723051 /DNA_START=26 /DNA_END=189 /DNA_ORIENTATION=-